MIPIGMPISASYYFLTELLRKKFGFDGYVVSDSDAVEFVFSKHHVAKDSTDAVRMVLEAGMNVHTNFEIPEKFILPARKLVKDGLLKIKTVDDRVSEVLKVKFRLGLFDHPYVADTKKADEIAQEYLADMDKRVENLWTLGLKEASVSPIKLDKFVI